ncbi:MAG: hypothetical protein HY914_15870 [Desulfomonile tiedjei]|nr:hypothetical protein [Desulfomonile tiedjei]
MKTVASHDFYEIAVDGAKNRIHLTNRGSWTSTKQIEGWLDDLAAAAKLCTPGFTALIDWTQSTGILLTDRVAEAQQLLMKAGLRKAARLFDRETFLKYQMDQVSQQTGFPVESFFDRREAEAWLDTA